jgi:hypothetical protein
VYPRGVGEPIMMRSAKKTVAENAHRKPTFGTSALGPP